MESPSPGGGSVCLGGLLQDSPGQSEYAFPSLDHPLPRSAGKPELATKCSGLALLVAGPGRGAVTASLPAVQSTCVSVSSSAGRKWSHHSWNDCLSTVPLLVSSCRQTGLWVPTLSGPLCCSSQPCFLYALQVRCGSFEDGLFT